MLQLLTASSVACIKFGDRMLNDSLGFSIDLMEKNAIVHKSSSTEVGG